MMSRMKRVTTMHIPLNQKIKLLLPQLKSFFQQAMNIIILPNHPVTLEYNKLCTKQHEAEY